MNTQLGYRSQIILSGESYFEKVRYSFSLWNILEMAKIVECRVGLSVVRERLTGGKAVKWLWKNNLNDPCGNRTSSSHYTGDQITKN